MVDRPEEKRRRKDSSSGHGASGLGGQPSDDHSDLESGGGGRQGSDRTAPGTLGARKNETPDVPPGAGVEDDEQSDKLQEALEETFPASDPPSFTPITSIGPPNGKDLEPQDGD